MYSAFASPPPPHILNQAPPGAQQLSLPDFLKVPHSGHVIGDVNTTGTAAVDCTVGVLLDILAGLLTGLVIVAMVEVMARVVVGVV